MPVRQCEYLLEGETGLIGEGRLEVAILQRVKLLLLLSNQRLPDLIFGALEASVCRGSSDVLGQPSKKMA